MASAAVLEIELGLPLLNLDFPDLYDIEIACYFPDSPFSFEIEREKVAILLIFLLPSRQRLTSHANLAFLTTACTRAHICNTAAQPTTDQTPQAIK